MIIHSSEFQKFLENDYHTLKEIIIYFVSFSMKITYVFRKRFINSCHFYIPFPYSATSTTKIKTLKILVYFSYFLPEVLNFNKIKYKTLQLFIYLFIQILKISNVFKEDQELEGKKY